MCSFSSQTHVTSDRHVVHCALEEFCWVLWVKWVDRKLLATVVWYSNFLIFDLSWHAVISCQLLQFKLHSLCCNDTIFSVVKKKGKGKSVPLQARSGPQGSRISWQWHRMVVRLSALLTGRLYPQEMLLVLISVRGRVNPLGHSAIGGILGQWKILMTPAAIEPATYRSVAQHLNHCATAVPHA